VRWGDLLITAILLGLCGLAVARHFDHDVPGPPPIPPLEVGEPLDGSLVVTNVAGFSKPMVDLFGKRATVLYSWKVACPCIDACEARLREVYARYGPAQGVEWYAVDGEPSDEPEAIREKMGRIGSFQKMLVDPTQRLSAKVGFDRAAQIAVLDATGHIRYRGSIDDDYKQPTRSYVAEALAAVVDGGAVPVPETLPVYGCAYSQEPVCRE
jgi:hypothetical protein